MRGELPEAKVFGTPSMANSLEYWALPSVVTWEGPLLKAALRERRSVALVVPGAKQDQFRYVP